MLHAQNLHLVKLAFAEFGVNGKQWEVMEGKLLRMVLRGRQLGDIDAMAHTLLSARDEQLRPTWRNGGSLDGGRCHVNNSRFHLLDYDLSRDVGEERRDDDC